MASLSVNGPRTDAGSGRFSVGLGDRRVCGQLLGAGYCGRTDKVCSLRRGQTARWMRGGQSFIVFSRIMGVRSRAFSGVCLLQRLTP